MTYSDVDSLAVEMAVRESFRISRLWRKHDSTAFATKTDQGMSISLRVCNKQIGLLD